MAVTAEQRRRRQAAVERLLELSDQPGQSERVNRAAAALDVQPRTVYRWLVRRSAEPRSPGGGFAITEHHRELLFLYEGCAQRVFEHLQTEGAALPSARHFRRCLARDLPAGLREFAREGEPALRALRVHLRWEPSYRNQRLEADHKQLDIWVLDGSRLVKPWVTAIVECYSRALVALVVSAPPTQASILVALREALVVDPSRGPFGGLPEEIRWDRGRDFLAHAVGGAAGELGIDARALPGRKPWLKGKVERMGRTVADEVLAGMPATTTGPRENDGTATAARRAPLALAVLIEILKRWQHEYNHRRHSAHGQTPAERFAGDPTPLRGVDVRDLDWMLLAAKRAKVRRDGIRFDGKLWVASELNLLGGQTVEVRYMPHDHRQIEVFNNGAHLTTCRPQHQLGPTERQALHRDVERQLQDLRAQQRRAERLVPYRLAPTIAADGIADVTTISEREVRASGMPTPSLDARAPEDHGDLELLGLGDELNTAIPREPS